MGGHPARRTAHGSRRAAALAAARPLAFLITSSNDRVVPHPRLGAVSFLHRFGSGRNRHAHVHACVADGVFLPGSHGPDGPPAFPPARPLTAADLTARTERFRRRVIGWFKRQGLLDSQAAVDMLAWQHGGFSIDASVRITLLVRYVLPRHKAANWGGPDRGRNSTRPGANGAVELSPFGFLARLAYFEPEGSQAEEGQDGFARMKSSPHAPRRTARTAGESLPPVARKAREKIGFKAGLRRHGKSGLERGYEALRHRHVRAASSPTRPD